MPLFINDEIMDRREITRCAVAVRDKSYAIPLRIAPFRTGIYGIAWVMVGVKQPHGTCRENLRSASGLFR